MKVAIIYNKDMTGVINRFGMQNKEVYNPRTVKKVAAALEKGGHNVEIIDGNMNMVENIQSFLPKMVEGEKMGIVFNMAYGIQGESRYTHIPSMLEMLGIPYVGSSPSGHALALDKVITKVIMQKNNIPTPDFWVFSSHEEDMSEVVYPVIVKPKMESVSFGLSVVNSEKDLREAVKFIIEEYRQQALVEQFIRGREFCVGLLGNGDVESFPVLEIDLENDPDGIQSVDDKRVRPRDKICPAIVSEELAEEMRKLSVAAFKALQLRDFARVDIRVDEDGDIYLLEINSMASLGQTGSYAFAASVAGYDYDALVNKMLDVGVTRYYINSPVVSEDKIAAGKKAPLNARVRSFLRGRKETGEKFLRQLTDINSHVRNVEGVKQLINLVRRQLSSLGFSYEISPQVEVGDSVFFTNSDSRNHDILLLGHLDNSVQINSHEYFEQIEQKIFGTGVWENKGGLTVMVLALQALRFTRLLKKARIGILLTSDDSLQGKFARSLVKKKSESSRHVIGLHGAMMNGGVISSRSGAAVYKCRMNLKNKSDEKYVPLATGLFSRLISSWTGLSDTENGVIVSPYDVSIKSNITERHAYGEAKLSVRFNEPGQIKAINDKIGKLIPKKKYKDILYFQLEGGERRPPMPRTDRTGHIWNAAKQIADKLDVRLCEEHRWSSADICFVDKSKYIIDGMGPVGGVNNNKSEYILSYSILERAALLAMLVNELSKKPK